MFKTMLVASACFGILATVECGVSSAHLSRKTTTEQPQELNAITATTAYDRVPAAYYKANNIPQVEEGCKIKYECKKKLKHAENPKPCIKFCIKNIECENGKKLMSAHGQCVELNEEMVSQEYNDCKMDEDSKNPSAMPVALIDFPCQPGYLPDSRGRCREVW